MVSHCKILIHFSVLPLAFFGTNISGFLVVVMVVLLLLFCTAMIIAYLLLSILVNFPTVPLVCKKFFIILYKLPNHFV